jgi:hypothetical protein
MIFASNSDRIGGLDTPLGGSADDAGGGRADGSERRSLSGWRSVLGWSGTSAPVALLLLAGMALGHQGINLLSSGALPLLNAATPVALAALGVLVGLGVGDRRSLARGLIAAALLGPALAMLVVAGGMAVLANAGLVPGLRPFWTLTIAIGVCAATSLTLPGGNPLEPRSLAARAAETGVLLPIIAGGVALASLRAGSPIWTLLLLGQACLVTLALAAAGWLLLTRAASETEERVFALSALLLAGGAAEALSLSALLGGLMAGVFWRYAGGRPRETIRRDVLFVQHPLLVLVLLAAGARADLSPSAIALGVAYVLLRAGGTLAGSAAARRVTGMRASGDLGRHLLYPGVFGVAFALNAVDIVGADASILLATVVVGTIGSEFVALLLVPRSVGE